MIFVLLYNLYTIDNIYTYSYVYSIYTHRPTRSKDTWAVGNPANQTANKNE